MKLETLLGNNPTKLKVKKCTNFGIKGKLSYYLSISKSAINSWIHMIKPKKY